MFSWTSLGSLLGSSTSRAIYVLPVAGYVILYADYFRSLHNFSTLPHGGFLTFSAQSVLIFSTMAHSCCFLLTVCGGSRRHLS